MNGQKIDKIYLVPVEEISCPACGRRYGHHKTKVDILTEECSACAKNNKDKKLVSADEYIQKHLGYKPQSKQI